MSSMDGMSPAALAAWESLNQKWGKPLKVNSAYRSPEHNAKVGGAKKSQHMHGNAFDVDVSGLSQEQRIALIKQARGSGFQGVGVYNNALHFDVGPSRAWGSDYTSKTLPSWASAAVGAPVGAVDAHQDVSHQGGAQAPTMGAAPNVTIVQTSPEEARLNALNSLMSQMQDTRQNSANYRNSLAQMMPQGGLSFDQFKV